MILSLRSAVPEDQIHLLDCDNKCFDYTWSNDAWSFLADSFTIRVVTNYGTPIGFSVYKYEDGAIMLPKLCVKPNYRRHGVGTVLLREVVGVAKQLGATHLEGLLPESYVTPGDPRDVAGWLRKTGWKAFGLEPDTFQFCGHLEDGVRLYYQV